MDCRDCGQLSVKFSISMLSDVMFLAMIIDELMPEFGLILVKIFEKDSRSVHGHGVIMMSVFDKIHHLTFYALVSPIFAVFF